MSIDDRDDVPDHRPPSTTATPRPLVAGPSSTSGLPYMPMGPIGVTGSVPVTRSPKADQSPGIPRPSELGVEVMVTQLVDAQYKGRRVRFKDVTGTLQGIVQPLGLALRLDGSTTARATEQKLYLVDDAGEPRYLPFTSTDRVRIVD